MVSACSDSNHARLARLRELAPDLSETVARHLVLSDDSTLTRYAREIGLRGVMDIVAALDEALRFDSVEEYEQNAAVLLSRRARVTEICAREYNWESRIDRQRYLANLNPEMAVRRNRLYLEMTKVTGDPNRTPEEKLDWLEESTPRVQELGDDHLAIQHKVCVADQLLRLGRIEKWWRLLHEIVAESYEIGYFTQTCQLLGVIGSEYEDRGQVDSMIVYWDEAFRIATEHKDPANTARILSFYAGHYQRKGRLSLTHDLLNQAEEMCRRYKGGAYELRYVVESMEFHANLGAWDVVERLLHRTSAFRRQGYAESGRLREFYLILADIIEARYLMAMGEAGAAEKIFRELPDRMAGWSDKLQYVEFRFYWAQGLVDNDQPARALPIIREGVQLSQLVSQPVWDSRFLLLWAKASLDLGDVETCEQSLERFEHVVLTVRASENPMRAERIGRDVLRARILSRENRHKEAIRSLDRSVERLRGWLAQTEASVHGYLWMGAFDEVRQMLHDLAGDDALVGYGAEFYWRDLCKLLRRSSRETNGEATWGGAAFSSPTSVHGRSLLEEARVLGSIAESRVMELDALHCTYLIRKDEVWRWTASKRGVRREILQVSVEGLRDQIGRARKLMASDPDDRDAPAPPKLISGLHTLASLLLPPEILRDEGRGHEQVLITADGFLTQFPFEALNLSRGKDYVPLLWHRDVAYVRHVNGMTASDVTQPGVILAGVYPPYAGRLNPTFPAGNRADGALEEGRAVAAVNADATFLHGQAATKTNLLKVWEDAGFIYIAAHMSSDPVVPYLRALPLASPQPSSGPEAAYLDFDDILSADLSRCKLVVLSGCSSGLPYLGPQNAAPSLADAFLDAGAGSVVQTLWSVRDDDAVKLMSAFIEQWEPADAIKILCAARRSAMSGPYGIRHPFGWAAYSIKKRGI